MVTISTTGLGPWPGLDRQGGGIVKGDWSGAGRGAVTVRLPGWSGSARRQAVDGLGTRGGAVLAI